MTLAHTRSLCPFSLASTSTSHPASSWRSSCARQLVQRLFLSSPLLILWCASILHESLSRTCGTLPPFRNWRAGTTCVHFATGLARNLPPSAGAGPPSSSASLSSFGTLPPRHRNASPTLFWASQRSCVCGCVLDVRTCVRLTTSDSLVLTFCFAVVSFFCAITECFAGLSPPSPA